MNLNLTRTAVILEERALAIGVGACAPSAGPMKSTFLKNKDKNLFLNYDKTDKNPTHAIG
jgi:hypothetical protein